MPASRSPRRSLRATGRAAAPCSKEKTSFATRIRFAPECSTRLRSRSTAKALVQGLSIALPKTRCAFARLTGRTANDRRNRPSQRRQSHAAEPATAVGSQHAQDEDDRVLATGQPELRGPDPERPSGHQLDLADRRVLAVDPQLRGQQGAGLHAVRGRYDHDVLDGGGLYLPAL